MPRTTDSQPADRLVVLHGFTQTHHHCHALALDLGARLRYTSVIVPDLPGHGLSRTDRSDFDAVAATLTEQCGSGTYVGYSMGGRFALASAVARPDLVTGLVLIGTTAGIDDATARAGRRELDEERARSVEDVGVDAFLEQWMAAPMFAGLPTDPEGLAHRRINTVDGLAHSLRTCGTGSMTPLWHRLGGLDVPALILAGEHDAKFTEIGRRLAEVMPAATFVSISDAGHAAHLEQPSATVVHIAEWHRAQGV